jgi:hypothetical protein
MARVDDRRKKFLDEISRMTPEERERKKSEWREQSRNQYLGDKKKTTTIWGKIKNLFS